MVFLILFLKALSVDLLIEVKTQGLQVHMVVTGPTELFPTHRALNPAEYHIQPKAKLDMGAIAAFPKIPVME
jgi:hypothetical protein